MTAKFVPHSGLIRSDDVGQGIPLKQAEITQFIRTIDTEVFEKKDEVKKEVFKRKSLFDLAKISSDRDKLEDVSPVLKDSTEQVLTSDIEDAVVISSFENNGLVDNLEFDVDVDVDEKLSEDTITRPEAESLQQVSNPVETTFDSAAITEAYERGLAEGQRLAEISVDEMMSHALGLLAKTTEAFVSQTEEATEVLAKSIEASVTSLASSRAGIAIDSFPEAFMRRIETLVERIQISTSKPIVKIHPADLSVLQTVFEQSKDLLDLILVEDFELKRGDIKVTLEGVRLTDMLPVIGDPKIYTEYVPIILSNNANIKDDIPSENDIVEEVLDREGNTPSLSVSDNTKKSKVDNTKKSKADNTKKSKADNTKKSNANIEDDNPSENDIVAEVLDHEGNTPSLSVSDNTKKSKADNTKKSKADNMKKSKV